MGSARNSNTNSGSSRSTGFAEAEEGKNVQPSMPLYRKPTGSQQLVKNERVPSQIHANGLDGHAHDEKGRSSILDDCLLRCSQYREGKEVCQGIDEAPEDHTSIIKEVQ